MSRLSLILVAAVFSFIAFGGLNEVAGAQDAAGTVAVQKYYCTYLDDTLLVEAIDEAECVTGGATFTFYLIGDGTADYEQLVVGDDGFGSIELPAGSYEMVEEGTQTFFTLTVGPAEPTNLLIANPSVDVAPTAVPTQPTAVPTQSTDAPVKLPSTGSGSGSEADVLVLILLAVAAATLAGGSALALRRNRA